MDKQLSKHFDFAECEARLYDWWEQHGWFKPEVADADTDSFVISMPPPNVTGALHIGHALFTSLQDVMVRYQRMCGKAALWVPGTDHAGIATQLQVEKSLRDEGTSRQELGRDEFLRRTWAWKAQYGGRIQQQLRRIGASCDWDRERFTLDDGLSHAVQDVFITLYEQELIYRGPRLVNWSPGLQTAVSDLEVERFDESAKLYYFNYPIDGGGFIPVATTRPETILADTAVAVHPEDDRYKHFVGQSALVPVLNRPIPVITDEYVDHEFGTGALKVTPGHDFNDYEIGIRHNLPTISAMNKDATMNDHAGPYTGLDRFECRDKLWADMEREGLVIRVEEIVHNVPRSQRGGELIEPMVSTQWFVKIQPLADRAIAAVREGQIKIVPEHFEKTYFHWLENIQDWCVSRQLWWGHRIPAWYGPNGEVHVGREAPNDGGLWTPDEDVLDTWFSSGLWPFSTLGWPEQTADVQRYYPTDVMETGYDILFFWVARMIMLGLWFTDEPPFHTVYLHGLVRDKFGRKISKTLGNTLDPLDLIDEYGADPVRFTLVTSGTPGNDVNLDPSRVEANWRFVNKLWQMTSFTLQNFDEYFEAGLADRHQLDLPSQWILSRTGRLVQTVQRLFDNYQFGEAGRQIYEFAWHEFADWYVEISKHPLFGDDPKARLQAQQVLVYVLDTSLRLLHPFMPFVTEELWQHIPHEGKALIIAPWPEVNDTFENEVAENSMAILIELVRGVRNVRKEYQVDPGKRISAIIAAGSLRETIDEYSYVFSRLCNIENTTFLTDDEKIPDDVASIVVGEVTLYLPLVGMVDIKSERKRLADERDNLQKLITKSINMLQNENFITRAKPEVVERERNRLIEFETQLGKIIERLEVLK